MQRYETLKTYVWGLLGQRNRRNFSEQEFRNGMLHLDSTAVLCGMIALRRDLDVEICKTAGLLHDLWLYLNMPCKPSTYARHGYYGSSYAGDILRKIIGYSAHDIEVICQMIHNHNDKDVEHDEYSEALKDADVLSHYINAADYDEQYEYYGRDEKILSEFGLIIA